MRVIKPYYEILTPVNRSEILGFIERIARVCYKSEEHITETSASDFVRMLIKRSHEAMIEHCSITVKFICDRGVSHEIVRHRIASYAQESTRFCNYSKDKFNGEITVIQPCFTEVNSPQYLLWESGMRLCEQNYFMLLDEGWSPQEARSVLPNSLKTELIMTANLREWRHFLKLRTDKAAHPQLKELTVSLLAELKEKLPEVFENIEAA
jgi:thymidylate synthase (FAD)